MGAAAAGICAEYLSTLSLCANDRRVLQKLLMEEYQVTLHNSS